jgi:hypothetical protein
MATIQVSRPARDFHTWAELIFSVSQCPHISVKEVDETPLQHHASSYIAAVAQREAIHLIPNMHWKMYEDLQQMINLVRHTCPVETILVQVNHSLHIIKHFPVHVWHCDASGALHPTTCKKMGKKNSSTEGFHQPTAQRYHGVETWKTKSSMPAQMKMGTKNKRYLFGDPCTSFTMGIPTGGRSWFD